MKSYMYHIVQTIHCLLYCQKAFIAVSLFTKRSIELCVKSYVGIGNICVPHAILLVFRVGIL